MRGLVPALLGALLVSSLLAGCVSSDDDPGTPGGSGGSGPRSPSSAESQRSFDAAYEAAKDATGAETLVAVVGIATADPTKLKATPGEYAGFQALADELIQYNGPVPGDGKLEAWAFLFEKDGGQIQAAVAPRDSAQGEVRVVDVDKSELVLLRVTQNVEDLPGLSPADALAAAMEVEDWRSTAEGSSSFILFLLTADSDGTQWRMIASRYEPLSGQEIRVDASTGSVKGSVREWPDDEISDILTKGSDEVNTKIPTDQESFQFPVPNQPFPRLHVMADRTATGAILGDPVVELTSPDGSTSALTHSEWTTVDDPEGGDWTVTFTWELPDLYRTIRVEYCIQPVPFLFAPQNDACSS